MFAWNKRLIHQQVANVAERASICSDEKSGMPSSQIPYPPTHADLRRIQTSGSQALDGQC
ncbi:MAG: hypothetical protein OES46_18170 [Gammaproteobacteria bacterium]|nr:hypothetical protein [Gammaproteobacteria bacterium]